MLYFIIFSRSPPALKVTMHLRHANSVASSLNCLKRVTTSCSAWISAMILFSLWESVFSVFIPNSRENKTFDLYGDNTGRYRIFYKILGVGYVLYGLPETARRVLESTGMAHCAIPNTNSSLQASSKRINCKKK